MFGKIDKEKCQQLSQTEKDYIGHLFYMLEIFLLFTGVNILIAQSSISLITISLSLTFAVIYYKLLQKRIPK